MCMHQEAQPGWQRAASATDHDSVLQLWYHFRYSDDFSERME